MDIAQELATGFKRNTAYLGRQLEGVGHEASLVQHEGANCLNWTVGHIINYRNVILRLLGIDEIEGVETRYANESEPITADGPDVLAFDRLKVLLGESGNAVEVAVSACGPADLVRLVEVGDQQVQVGSRISFFFFHDTLHVGQADVLAAIG